MINKRKMIFSVGSLRIQRRDLWPVKKLLNEWNNFNVKKNKRNGIRRPFHRKNHMLLVWISKLLKMLQTKF